MGAAWRGRPGWLPRGAGNGGRGGGGPGGAAGAGGGRARGAGEERAVDTDRWRGTDETTPAGGRPALGGLLGDARTFVRTNGRRAVQRALSRARVRVNGAEVALR